MLFKIILSIFIVYATFRTLPWSTANAPNTITALDRLVLAVKNDTIAVLYNQTFFIGLRAFIKDIDSKMLDYYEVLSKNRQ